MFICTTLDVSKSCSILFLCLMFQVVSGYRSYFSANSACCTILICCLCSTFRIVRVVNFLQDEEIIKKMRFCFGDLKKCCIFALAIEKITAQMAE